MAAPPQVNGKLLLVLVTLYLCCPPVSGKKNKIVWLESILMDLASSYNKFAGKEGNPKTMNTHEFCEYLKSDFPVYIQGKDPDIVEKTLASLDEDKDGELNYKEFFEFQIQFMLVKYQANNKLHA